MSERIYIAELFVCEYHGPGTQPGTTCKRSMYKTPGEPTPKCDRMGHDRMVSAGLYELPEERV